VVIALCSVAVLVAFQHFDNPDLSGYTEIVPLNSLGGVVLSGVVFSLLNATVEEFVFRGLLFDAVVSQWGVLLGAIGTAMMFGLGHMRGYPPDVLGISLAAVYGLALAWLRVHTGGLGQPILAHIVADATIFIIIASAIGS
jgi:membrane protease YdiL (CAAX protease family)